MRAIPLLGKYSDQYVLVDDEDFDLVSALRWQRESRGQTFYARARLWREGLLLRPYMHSFITGFAMVDHINGDGLDNRRSNLRAAVSAENNRNKTKQKTISGRPTSSKFKGVSWSRRGIKHWRSYIQDNGKFFHLGTFSTEEEAARAYDAAAQRLFGAFAKLNFSEDA